MDFKFVETWTPTTKIIGDILDFTVLIQSAEFN